MERKIILGIDFCNMLFASSYAEKLINSKGMNVNAIKGFFFKIKSLKDTFNPDYIVLASDVSREKTFRRKLYKPYKAQRKEHDPDLMEQLKYAGQLVALLGYPNISNELYEADDVLGMISRFVANKDYDFVIASSDQDLYQLITDETFIFSPRNKELIDKDYMWRNYKLTPEQWIEYKMLFGDAGDNIPGVQGCGKITSIRLMQDFGSIENIFKHINSLKPGLQEALKKMEPMFPLTRELVTIVTDPTKIELTEDQLWRKDIYKDEIYKLLEELELYSLYNIMEYSLFY